MKPYGSALWIILLAGQSGLWGQEKVASIAYDDSVKDFGKVMQGEMLEHVFGFSNRGSGTLEILGVEATCGCQTNTLSDTQILPGQSGRIEINVDTALLSGSIEETARVTTNDPRRRKVFFTIKADVQPEIRVSSPSVYFGDVPEGELAAREVTLTVAAGKSIEILSARSSEDGVAVKLEPVPESGGKTVRLIATHKGDGKFGYRTGSITVKTTSTLTPELSIYLFIRNLNR
ncbi:MAG: DUF1573 domain-containing protein [Acidobacteria bacterium]|nr:DUF1573 domain-containing protein [Acidobacteriota bacterium]